MKKVSLLAIAAMAYCNSALAAGQTGWLRDFEKAKGEAAKRNVPVLINFSGSDWCFWCKKLDAEVLSKDAFRTFAEKNLVLMLADFPTGTQIPEKEAKQNEELAQKLRVQGYPTLVLLSPDGKVIGTTGYRRGGADAYVEHLKALIDGARR